MELAYRPEHGDAAVRIVTLLQLQRFTREHAATPGPEGSRPPTAGGAPSAAGGGMSRSQSRSFGVEEAMREATTPPLTAAREAADG